ncbi:hypothetical protein [Nitrosomonas ureae]|uniref:Uncharacterized protein n=1 Tax=Nitrosomonas ureae TaxID=44577 RepID=A0A1H5UHZ5_9PROT|nr:hypothetical protein [Nitrosomonas ureae]SEF74650.1 hypothetical protein SAMN05216334_1088 [Nitrosomonas ureae]
MNNLTVSEVKFFRESRGVVTHGFHIERPVKGVLISGDQFVVSGWVVGKASHAIEVNVCLSEEVVGIALVSIDRPDVERAYPVEGARSSGFRIDVPVISLQVASEINVIARLEDGTKVPLANICFEKQAESGIAIEKGSQEVNNISDQEDKLGELRPQVALDYESKKADSISEQEGIYTRFVNRLKSKFSK